MQQISRAGVEACIKSMAYSYREMGFSPKSVILGSDLPMIESQNVGVPCSVSHSQPANQMQIVNQVDGKEAGGVTITFEKQPLIPDWLTERFKDAGLLKDT